MEESNEARTKFANAKAISSSQFFGDKSKAEDPDSKARLQKFAVCICFSSVQCLNFRLVSYSLVCIHNTPRASLEFERNIQF